MPFRASFQPPAKKIGIIAGSGPEAGMDLWAKVLSARKRALGGSYRGDLDAPHVTIISDPCLGLSMEMLQYEETVWSCLKNTVSEISALVDYFTIACNTLNCFRERLQTLVTGTRFVSFFDVVADFLERQRPERVCLLGARPVLELGRWSAYRTLPDIVDVELPPHPDHLHRLIYDIKTHGAAHSSIKPRFEQLLENIDSHLVLLACTELPLLKRVDTDKELVDVTELVAEKLVALCS